MNKGFRMWKSGKHWLFASGVIFTLGLGMSQPSILVAQAIETNFYQSENKQNYNNQEIDQLHPALEDEEYNKRIEEDNKNIQKNKIMFKNGIVADNKTSVSRTSEGFTATNVSEDVKSVKVAWLTDNTKIKVNVNNAFYISTPFSFDVELNKPLAKNESVIVPLKINGQIFNASSKSSVRGASQNNGNYYVSQDKNYSYNYDPNKQEVTITDLTDASFTKFQNMTYFVDNEWVPVPLRESPYPLSGGVKGNYGAKGSGGTIIVSVGNNSTSETVTNTEDIAFTDTIVKSNNSIIERGVNDIISNSTAKTSNNFLGGTSEVIAQSNKGRAIDLLDGSMDHYTIKPISNSKANKTGETDPYSLIRTEFYIPIGSSSTTNNIKVIAGGFTVNNLSPLKNVFKNAKYNKETGILEFDLSRNASDWGKMADQMLVAPEYANYLKTDWITSYLKSMSGSNPNHNTLYFNLYEVSPQAYSPINYNLPLKTDLIVKNSKTNKSVTQHLTVNPVSAGNGLATQAGITALYVDEKTGEPIGNSSETKFFDPATGYTFKAPGIPGYKYVSKNDSELISKLGVTDVVDEIGKVTTNMVGKQSYILYSYTKGGTVVTSFKDTANKTLKPPVVSEGNDGDKVQTKAEAIPNYFVKDVVYPQTTKSIKQRSAFAVSNIVEPNITIKAGEKIAVDYIYDNKVPVTYSVVDDTDNKTIVNATDFDTAILGTTFKTDDRLNKIKDIQSEWTSKGYVVTSVENGDLPDPTDQNGYNVTIHLKHNTFTKNVPGKDAITKIPDKIVKQTIQYVSTSLPSEKLPADNIQSFNFEATVEQTIDSITNKVISEKILSWSPEQATKEIISPTIKGYTVDTEKIPVNKLNYQSKDSVIKVAYLAKSIPVTYTVIDDTDNKILENKSNLAYGFFDTPFDTDNHKTVLSLRIKNYTIKGYLVDYIKNEDLPPITTEDGYDVEIHLKHNTFTKNIPGIEAITKVQDKSVTQTIQYKGLPEAKTPINNIQKFIFSATVEQTIDSVNNKVLSEKIVSWSPEQSTKSTTSPTIKGYTPDKTSVESQNVNYQSKDNTITVTYKAKDIPVTYSVIDDTDNKTLQDKTNFSIGKFDSDFNTDENKDKLSNILKGFENKGYLVDSVKNKDLPEITTEDGYNIEVHLVHNTFEKVVPGVEAVNKIDNKIVTKTINYTGLPKDKELSSNVQKFTFTSKVTQTIDSVNNKVLKESAPVWSGNQNTKNVISLDVTGYTPDKAQIPSEIVSYSDKDSVKTVNYTPIDVSITYSVIDDSIGKEIVTKENLFTNKFDYTPTQKEFDLLDNIKEKYKKLGYDIKITENPNLPKIENVDGYNVVFRVTHTTSEKTIPGNSDEAVNKQENRKITQTINYTGLKDKTKLPPNNVQTWEFESKVTQTIDNVTGKVIAETDADWNLKGKTIDNIDSIAVDTPLFKGYTPDIKQVKSKNINSNTENSNITVTYKAIPAKVKFVYIDVDNSSSESSSILKEDELDGNWDENWDYSDEAKRAIKDFEDNGYQLLNKDDVTGTYSDEEKTYYITFKHRLKEIPNSETKDITKTISYKNDKGEQISPNNIQLFHFSNTTTLDMVTGENVQDNWGELQKEEDVKSPDITGYTPYKVEGDVNENSTPELIKGNDVSSNSEDNNITVIYSANLSLLNIHFIDVNDLNEDSFDKGREIKESEINISGKYNESWDAMSEITKEIENLKSKGYLIVKQDNGISQGIFGAEDTNLNIFLKHNTEFIKGGKLIDGKKDTKYNKEVTQTIEYKGIDNLPNDTQSFTFADNVEYDLVTGEVVSVKDDDSEFKTDEVISPKVQGYTIDKEKVESNTITRNDDNSTIVVTYKEKPKETVVKPDKPTEPNKEVPNKEVPKKEAQDKTPDVKRKPDIKTGIQNIKKNPTLLVVLTGLLLVSIIGLFKVKKK